MLLMRGATGAFAIHSDEVVHISIHAPYARSDLISMSVPPSTSFQSTLLMRGATNGAIALIYQPYISIHAPHARSDTYTSRTTSASKISIHAPHARSDGCSGHPHHTLQSISIHAPHARSDPAFLYSRRIRFRFQSTLLMRGATDVDFLQGCFLVISIHAPHARSDQSL